MTTHNRFPREGDDGARPARRLRHGRTTSQSIGFRIMASLIIRLPTIVLAALFAGAASGTTPTVVMSGPHANEEFCKTMIRQVEQSGEYVKLDPLSPDKAKREVL